MFLRLAMEICRIDKRSADQVTRYSIFSTLAFMKRDFLSSLRKRDDWYTFLCGKRKER